MVARFETISSTDDVYYRLVPSKKNDDVLKRDRFSLQLLLKNSLMSRHSGLASSSVGKIYPCYPVHYLALAHVACGQLNCTLQLDAILRLISRH